MKLIWTKSCYSNSYRPKSRISLWDMFAIVESKSMSDILRKFNLYFYRINLVSTHLKEVAKWKIRFTSILHEKISLTSCFVCSLHSRDVARNRNCRDNFSVHHLLLNLSPPSFWPCYGQFFRSWPSPSNKIKEIKGEWRINFLLDAKFYTRIVSV